MKKENWYRLLYTCSALLILGFFIRVGTDYVQYDTSGTSFPFNWFIVVRLVQFILPSVIIFIIGKVLKKKYN